MADITGEFYNGAAQIGYGSEWQIAQGDDSPQDFVSVADIESIEFGEMNAPVVNITHLRSPGRAHEKIATIRDLGPFTMNGNLRLAHGSQNNAGGDGFTAFDAEENTGGGLIALHRQLAERDMKIILADGTELPFRGVINSLKLGTVTLDQPTKFTAQVQPLRDYTAELP